MDNFNYKKYLSNNPLTEAYVPGEGWSEDFEYDDMLAHGLTLTADTPLEDLQKVVNDFEDVNYHREAAHLFDAINTIKAGDRGEAKMYINKFHKEIKTTLAGFDDVNDDYTIDENKENKETKNTKMKKSQFKKYLKEEIKSVLREDSPFDEDYERESRKREYNMDYEAFNDEFPEFPESTETYGTPEYFSSLSSDEENLDGMFGIEEAEKEGEEEEENISTDDEGDIELEIPEDELTDEKDEIQSNLRSALEAAKQLGDKKLIDQIGNTITFYTRTHIVGTEEDKDLELNESKNRMKKLAGLSK